MNIYADIDYEWQFTAGELLYNYYHKTFFDDLLH